jgi:phosphohistidine phosphatase
MTGLFFLVRHAKAEPGAAGGDAARPLSAAGRAAFAGQAGEVAARARITRIVTSPLTRARQTARLLAEATGAPVEEDHRLGSGASSGRELLALGARLGAGTALVGHNPELAEAVRLAGGQDAEVPPGAVAAVGLDGRLAWLRPR